tara:strand:- start:589 stop:1098 length:510 start_codon:yes stop_codon:yes gene_type:complete
MNILAGKFKGRNIKTSFKLPYRPTKSRVRKSIFDSLNPFSYASALDLFSGSGIFGFEAASRGADSVTFVERHHTTFSLIKENAELLSGPNYYFYKKDVFSFLNGQESYDLIFADPPYDEYDLKSLSQTALEHLNKKGKFILECDKRQVAFLNASVKDYGKTRILYWEKV